MKNIIHWCQPKRRWTSHTYKTCAKAEVIVVTGEWHTETKPNKRSNPKGWIVTDSDNVIVNPSDNLISKIVKKERLIYDKNTATFNSNRGTMLLFDREGCHLVEVI